MTPLEAAVRATDTTLGQLFLVGFHGTEPEQDLRDLFRALRPSGVILFRRNLLNPEQILRLTTFLQETVSDPPLFVAVDEEGGRVRRLPDPFTHFPSARILGRSRSPQLAAACASVIAREMRTVGLNFNFAPVLDVDTRPENPVIGDRSFGGDPELVASLGLATLEGFRREGVLGLVKHFPGHGDTSEDSHLTLPVVPHGYDRLEQVELAPFRMLCRRPDGPEALMTAHVLYPALDSERPATLSPQILTGLLRHRLGYRGLVVTDDLEMRAVADRFDPETAAVSALQAGADQLLFCHTPTLALRCLHEVARALDKGILSEVSIAASLERVRALKEKYLRPPSPNGPLRPSLDVIGCPEHAAVSRLAFSFASSCGACSENG